MLDAFVKHRVPYLKSNMWATASDLFYLDVLMLHFFMSGKLSETIFSKQLNLTDNQNNIFTYTKKLAN